MLSSMFPKAHVRYLSLPLLGGYLEGLCEWLVAQDYPPDEIRRRVKGARLLERSLHGRHIHSLKDCTPEELISCLPKPTSWTAHMAAALARSLEQYLQERGALASTPATPTSRLVAVYRKYLEDVRGLATATVNRHAVEATDFLEFLAYNDHPQGLQSLRSAEIDACLAKASQRLGRASMQKVTAILRALLKFLAIKGLAPPGLDGHVESPRLYRGERLPRALPWDSVFTLLSSVDRSNPKGRRDYAMLLLIATYGLRISEVANLELDNIDWRNAQIQVPRPKVGTALILPLTDEIAGALFDYLRNARPDSSHRRLFLRVRVPPGPIKPTAVNDVFDAWARHSGIRLPRLGGPHCLRHSLAMDLLQKGTPLKTIGDLLGHRSVGLSPSHACDRSRNGRFIVLRQTIAKRMRAKLAEIKCELRRRLHHPTPSVGRWLRSVVQGHFQYYAVPRNQRKLDAFKYQVRRLWLRSLRRRSQRHRITGERMDRLAAKWLPPVRTLHPYPEQRLRVTTRGRSPVR